jgi:hypothetical protein
MTFPEDTREVRQSRKRRWPWILGGALVLAVAAVQIYRLTLRHHARQELAAVRAKGYPASAEELHSWPANIPEGENAAFMILDAIDRLAPPDVGFSGIDWPIRSGELAREEKVFFRTLVSDNEAALEELRADLRFEISRFPVDWSLGFGALLPHLSKVKDLVLLFRAEALVHAAQDQPDLAVKSLVDGLALARSLDLEPLLISQLVRIACLSIMISALEDLLSRHGLPEAQLQELSVALQRAESQTPFTRGLVGELCMGSEVFRVRPAELAVYLGESGMDSPWVRVAYPLYALTGLRERDFLFYLRTMRQMIEVSELPVATGLVRGREYQKETERLIASRKLLIFSRMLLPSLNKASMRAAENEARLRCAGTALGLERYRRLHGEQLPDELASLAGAFLASVPADPFDDQPLRYRKLDRGYVIYSVGPDLTDDGGLEKKSSRHGLRPPGDVTFIVER